ncbi:MAG: ABC transporter substrate-binding protein [Chloroflexi bacterium]|nr:ABC transporter substrate-binding protein [Chloroflexota bacterium]
MDRRGFLRATVVTAVGLAAASCAQPTPQVIEKQVPVEKVVKETVVVQKEVAVEKVVTATPVPVKFREAPMVAGLVQSGALPPVDERLPEEPLVITPWEEIGQYGGTWHHLATGASDTQMQAKMTYEWLVRYDKDGAAMIPNVVKSWEISPDGTQYTFSLRKGMKWSDGEPYTADDIVFRYEDEWLVKELSSVPSTYKAGGQPIVIEKVDDSTFRCKFAAPYGLFMRVVAGLAGGTLEQHPKHYLQQFHLKYADKAALDKAVKDAGYEQWNQLFNSKTDPRTNQDLPVINAWSLKGSHTKQPIVFERNPYYWKVDPEGNQLPYIDRIEFMLVETAAQAAVRAVAGEVDMQLRHMTIDNYPLFQENKEKGDYRILLWNTGRFDVIIGVNQTNKDPVLRQIVQDKRFRYALSLGMNRPEIIEAAFLGLTEPSQVSPLKSSPHYWEPQAKDMTVRDVAKANAYLDEMGLTQRDSEGYRLRPDGKRLTLIYQYAAVIGAWGIIGELLTPQWKEIGVELIAKEVARQLYEEQEESNSLDLGVWTGSGEFDPLIEPRCFMPYDKQGNWGLEYFKWWASEGKEGEEPTGDVRKVLELWDQVKVTVDEAEQVKLFRQILELNHDNLWFLGVCTPAPTLLVVKNSFRNVPADALFDDQVRGPGHTATEQYFWKQ